MYAGMGYQGAALASSVSSWLQFLLLALYAAYFKVQLHVRHALMSYWT